MKVVYVTQRVEIIKSYGDVRDCIDIEWVKLLQEAGYLPIMVNNNENIIYQMLEEIPPNGIILTGGNDLYKYGGTARERDNVEKILIRYAIEKDIPLIGVCRGMQIIADYFGGELKKVENHVAVEHEIIEGDKKDIVNSYHNYAVCNLPEEIRVLATTADGVIEAIEHKNYRIYGQMWHPERYNPFRQNDILRIQEVLG